MMARLTLLLSAVLLLICIAGSAGPDQPTPGASPSISAAGQSAAAQPAADTVVYITRTGACFHRAGCRYLAKSCFSIYRSQAVARGYRACSKCRP